MNYNCEKCAQVCKTLRGLRVHQAKCLTSRNIDQPNMICNRCTRVFSSKYNLDRHLESCVLIESTKVIDIFNHFKNQVEERIEEKDEMCKMFVKQERQHAEALVKQIEHERENTHKNLQNALAEIEELKDKIKNLEDEKKKLSVDHREMTQKMIYYAEKSFSTTGTTIVNNVSNIQNQNNTHTLQLQHFNPSVITGYITPPDVVIRTVSQLVDHIIKLGFGNFYRISDRSRKSILWYDETGKEIKDSNCSMIAKRVINTLRPELDRQQAYLDQELEEQIKKPATLQDFSKISSLRENIAFTRSLKDENGEVMKSLQNEIATRAKDKQDTSVDVPKIATFNKFIHALEQTLVPNIPEWIDLVDAELGVYIKTKMSSLIKIEGASTGEKPYFVIRDDDDFAKIVYEKDLIQFFFKAVETITPKKTIQIMGTCLTKKERELNPEALSSRLEWLSEHSDISGLEEKDDSIHAILQSIVSTR